jgi:hypothetical protein
MGTSVLEQEAAGADRQVSRLPPEQRKGQALTDLLGWANPGNCFWV